MPTHVVYLDVAVTMDEMDGSPESSADILLDIGLVSKVEALIRSEGYDVEVNVVDAEETEE